MKKLIIATLICALIICTSLISAQSVTVSVVDRVATYQVYYPIVGWTTISGPQAEYRTLTYTNGYQFVRAESFNITYDAGFMFTGRIIGTQYYYQTW